MPRNLNSLLLEEWFLLMVFEHLVEHGLHDCRLVCRKWYESCQQFPVKLVGVGGIELQKAIEGFPKATSISILDIGNKIPAIDLFRQLSSSNRLRSLTLESGAMLLSGLKQPFFRSVPPLTEMKLSFFTSSGMKDVFTSIDHLTSLTKLKIATSPWIRSLTHTFTRLERVRELDVEFDIFTDEQGACCFPSLTNLTRLDLTSQWRNDDHVVTLTTEVRLSSSRNPVVMSVCLQAASHHAATLEYLNLQLYSRPATVVFSPLTTLTHLTALEIELGVVSRMDFWPTFERMKSLKRLCIDTGGSLENNTSLSIAMLTGLKALHCPKVYMHGWFQDHIPLAPRMTQLTELAACLNGKCINQLSSLTQLRRLKLTVDSDEPCSPDDVLICAPYLQTIDIEFRGYSTTIDPNPSENINLSTTALSDLDRLQSVSLKLVTVDVYFFQQLASKPQLTKLEFMTSKKKVYPCSFLSQVNQLRNLQELKLDLADQCYIPDMLSPEDLTRLKRLNVSGTEREVLALRNRFASVGQVLINHGESRWYSRSLV